MHPTQAASVACCLLAFGLAPSALAGGGSCCPADVDGDAVVGPADLATLLGSWGLCTADCPKTTVVGRLTLPGGVPAPHAQVTTSLGGSGVSGKNGNYGFDVNLDGGRGPVTLSASVTLDNVTYEGTAVIDTVEVDGVTDVGPLLLTPTGTCAATWLAGFGPNGTVVDGAVNGIALFDDHSGGGTQLYIGGAFSSAGTLGASKIAKWNGTTWAPIANVFSGSVQDMVVYDDGSGPALYVAGTIPSINGVAMSNVAKWNGNTWSPLGSGVNALVRDLQVFDDGSGGGPKLYAAGDFTTAGGAPASHVARWNGQSWSALGAGVPGGATCLGVHDDASGTGPALYVGGNTVTPGAIAKWNGQFWLPLGSGLGGTVQSMTTYDDGTGPALYVGGGFATAGGQPAKGVARWKNGAWSALGAGITGTAYSLVPFFDVGNGEPSLFVGGVISQADSTPVMNFARWNGSAWSSVGATFSGKVSRIAPLDPGLGGGTVLHMVGDFLTGPSGDAYIARWGCVPTGDRR